MQLSQAEIKIFQKIETASEYTWIFISLRLRHYFLGFLWYAMLPSLFLFEMREVT